MTPGLGLCQLSRLLCGDGGSWEDETGLINVVVSVGCWTRYAKEARNSPALLIRGRVERQETVVNIVAEKLEPLLVGATPKSRDFR